MSTEAAEHATAPAMVGVRLVLLVALALGIGAMHTLGHLQETDRQETVAASVVTHTDPVSSEATLELLSLDPTSVCLALAGMAFVLLGVAPPALVPRPGGPVRPPPWLWRAACHVAPPAPPCLAKLQVLRI
ncbi:hypothetical protein [Salinactinospora qingdaonensis]|uniref:Uncharacterized protein n=1 Tax=Salinactinospora qingdaonensis TaxID=702744 RepID=A0ABP7FAD1_9ACTN